MDGNTRPANGLRGCGNHDRFGNAGVSSSLDPTAHLPQSSSAPCFTAGAFNLRKAMTAWPRRLKEAVLFLHFELIDEYSEMPGHGGRKGVVLVLQALPNC